MQTVLIVDDSEVCLDLYEAYLEGDGYAILLAPDGIAGLDLMRHSSVRLVVVLNLLMPYMDGMDVLRHASAEELLDRHAVVIASASAEHSLREPDLLAILDRYHIPVLHKPIDRTTMREAVTRAAQSLHAA